jgi:hypothetical protein
MFEVAKLACGVSRLTPHGESVPTATGLEARLPSSFSGRNSDCIAYALMTAFLNKV